MDSIFGRKKPRPRQSSITESDLGGRSIPYDRLAPSARSPISVSPVFSSFNRATGISAPVTNPTLTDDGTDLNIRQLQKGKAQRDRMYEAQYSQDSAAAVERQRQREQPPQLQPDLSISPTKESPWTRNIGDISVSSSTLAGSATPRRRETPSEASLSPSTTKATLVDFGTYSPSPGPSFERLSSTAQTQRTSSSRTTDAFTIRPRYASSVTSNGSDHTSVSSHLRDVLPIPGVRNSSNPTEEFHFPRPQHPEEIEVMFQEVQSRLNVDGSKLGLEQKWLLVYNDAQIRWKEERARQVQQRKSVAQGSTAQAVYTKDTPEWYLKKFMDQTVTAKHVGSLTVSLRTLPVECVLLLYTNL
jgi:cytokinesis protein